MKFEIRLVDDIKHWYKLYSVWFFTTIGCLPDLYNQAITSGIITQDKVPPFFSHLVSTIAFLGLAFRLIKQKKDQEALDPSPSNIQPLESVSVAPSTLGIAVVSPVPANVQAALDENDLIKQQEKADAELRASQDKSHLL